MKFSSKHYIILILLIATALRFYDFTSANVITDESLNAIRSIGMIDFDVARTQTTPWQWVEKVPVWMHFSMHDHPILTYFISHIFFLIFGSNLWGLRLPFILAGILSVYLIFLIGKKLFTPHQKVTAVNTRMNGLKNTKRIAPIPWVLSLGAGFNEKIGLISAFVLAINSYHIWISRIALQESIVILFILLAFYYFLKSLENKKHFIVVFILLALSILSKYTALILIPIFLIILIQQKKLKEFLTSRYFWLGFVIFLIILSPSIIYNIKMQQTFGHLDFQLSSAFGQKVEEWNIRIGREMVGGIKNKIINLPIKLKQGLSWPMLAVFISSYFLIILSWLKYSIFKKSVLSRNNGEYYAEQRGKAQFVLITTITLWLYWYLIIGSTQRFLTYVIPFFCLALGFLTVFIWQKIKTCRSILFILSILFVLFLLSEIIFTANTLFTFRPKGKENIAWARTHFEVRDWGFNNLDQYLNNLLKNKMPARTMPVRYNFLTEIQNNALKKMREQKKEPFPVLIIYDSNIDDLSALWFFHRRSIYWAWPIIDAKLFFEVLASEGADFYQKNGISDFYFILPTENTLLETEKSIPLTDFGKRLEKSLIKNNTETEEIKNKIGEIVFKVYKF